MVPIPFRHAIALATSLTLLASTPTREVEPVKFMRHPHISNDGTIAFSYHSDIWLADRDGSNPRRLTAHVARDVTPRFSPDGQMIAFTSNRMGNSDVYVVPVRGGDPRQLTYHTGNDEVLNWTPDGTGIIMSSARGQHAWGSPLYVVPLDGSIPVPLPMDMARTGMLSRDGSQVAFTRSLSSYWRKGYKGNSQADIFVQDMSTKQIRQLTDTNHMEFREHVQDAHPMWGADGQIYFQSERSGTYNIWRMDPRGGAPVQVTRHTTAGVQFPSISPDGRTIIYENEFDLWTLTVPDGQPQRLRIAMDFDRRQNLLDFQTADNRADGFSVSPSGDYLAVDYRGDIVIVPVDGSVGEKTQVTATQWRERNQEYSPNGRHIAYISDESREEEIWLYEVATGTKRKLTTHESTKSDITWAPNSSKFAWTGANRLFETDIATGRTTELGHNPAGGFSISEYSADNNWLVYSKRDDSLNGEIFLFDTRSRRETNVTRDPGGDFTGRLTPDGRTLVFTSNRDGGTTHLYAVSLARLTEDPSDPVVRERQRRAQPDTARPAGQDAQPAAPAVRGGPTQIDAEGIDKRARQLTSGSNGASTFFLARDGRTVYFLSSDNDGAGLFQIGIDGRDRRKVASGSFPGITPTPDRRTVFYRQTSSAGPGSEIHKMTMSNQRKERVNFSFPVRIDMRAEREQIFEEAWRVMKYRFYDENMHGVDWDAAKRRYLPILPHVGDNEDLYDLANEMIGELNASHTGVSGPASRPMPRGYGTRYLGFELEPAGSHYRITHIYRDGPADREWLGLAVGDYVLAIDGKDVRAGDNYWKILTETLNNYVPVRVAKSAGGQGARTVRIASVTSLNEVKYEEWVAQRREFVEEESGGRIAYVHIRSMNQPSLERFRNEINQYWDAEGIVVDIRYNGGGNIDQELIDILERRPYQFWNSRTGSRAWGRRPRQAIAGPKVMLVNQRSGSDSEVTPMGFRDLGIGRIVGTPTAGAVIATGSYSLINGGSIRTPGSLVVQWDPSKPNNFGINLENYGVAPDVWARNTPEDELRGFDRELKAAVDEALRMLGETRYQYIGGDGRQH